MEDKFKWIMITFTPITALLNLFLKRHPKVTEKYYSNGINRYGRQVLSKASSFFKFSMAEFLIILFFIILIILLISLCISIKKGEFARSLLNVFSYLSLLYVAFMFLWGFNYNRIPLETTLGLKIENSSIEELYGLCEELIFKANGLREMVKEDSQGVMTILEGYESVLNRAEKGYQKASVYFPEIGGKYGLPKPIFLSKQMSYTGISGIFVPYTGEPNINTKIPYFMLPVTVSHEIAHQRGFAREDEANYIAYLTSSMHPDIDFQYSATMLALIYSTGALYETDEEKYKQLSSKYSDKVKRDLQYQKVYWEEHRGWIEKISRNVNNLYLKSNGQQDGVKSYGRMVDLLLAERQKRQSKQ